MTIEEFKNAFEHDAAIRCKNMVERAEALIFLEELGYELGDRQRSYLDPSCTDSNYLNPVHSPYKRVVCTSRRWVPKDIPFEVVAELMGDWHTDYSSVIDQPLAALFEDVV